MNDGDYHPIPWQLCRDQERCSHHGPWTCSTDFGTVCHTDAHTPSAQVTVPCFLSCRPAKRSGSCRCSPWCTTWWSGGPSSSRELCPKTSWRNWSKKSHPKLTMATSKTFFPQKRCSLLLPASLLPRLPPEKLGFIFRCAFATFYLREECYQRGACVPFSSPPWDLGTCKWRKGLLMQWLLLAERFRTLI